MKKILKILLTIVYLVLVFLAVIRLLSFYTNDKLLFIVLSILSFLLHIFVWFAPKTFFNICWKISNYLPDNYDYETSFSRLEWGEMGLLISSFIFALISLI